MFDIEEYLEDNTGKKYCSKCKEWKLVDLFPRNKNSKDGLNHWCNKLEKDQNGLCKICLRKKKLVIEHCHTTKRVRGLTCNGCNVKISWYERNKHRIEEHVK